jgi:DNA adenine methylase
MFSREDFEKMAVQLGSIKGRFILSINDHPEIRRVFASFNIEEIETSYTISKAKRVTELLISNL